MEKILKKALFGYSKKSVCEYLQELDLKTRNELSKREDAIDDLTAALDEEKEKNSALTQKYNELEKQVLSISAAIITAQKHADEIVSKAQESANKILENAEVQAQEIVQNALVDSKRLTSDASKELESIQNKKNTISEEVRKLKNSLMLSAAKYKENIEKLVKGE